MATITYTGRLTVVTCTCGINFAIPEDLNQRALDNRGPSGLHIRCPLGHSWHYVGKTDAQRRTEQLAADLERERRSARWLREERDAARQLAEHERRSAAAYKGHLTRIRKRIANGVCPVPGCKRSGFDRVLAHIASQHPDWLHAHPEITDG